MTNLALLVLAGVSFNGVTQAAVRFTAPCVKCNKAIGSIVASRAVGTYYSGDSVWKLKNCYSGLKNYTGLELPCPGT